MFVSRRTVFAACLASVLAAWSARADMGMGTRPPPTSESECESVAPGFDCPDPDPLGLGKVQLFSGEYDLQEVDMRIPGVGFDFIMKRRYLSREHDVGPQYIGCQGQPQQFDIDSLLGLNWDFSYNIYMTSELAVVTIDNCTDQ